MFRKVVINLDNKNRILCFLNHFSYPSFYTLHRIYLY